MPHAGHFICAYKCQFHLNTCVGKFIVSTIGEMTDTADMHRRRETQDWEELGVQRKYETMVFPAVKDSKNACCPFAAETSRDLSMEGYNTAADAYKGHLRICAKYSKK